MEAVEIRRHYQLGGGLFGKPATIKAVDGVSFTLKAGRTLAIVGESGCGKSTLARVACLLDDATSGELLIDGKAATTPAARKALRRSVQMVFQNPYGSLNPRKTVGSILEEPLAIHRLGDRGQRREQARAMFDKVGLRQDQFGRYPHMFSGGQRQRIAIARALMLNPRVVIADEPVSALDVSIRAQVLNLMMDLQDELELAYLFISHDLSVVRHMADDIMVMYLGRPVEQGSKTQIFTTPRHPYTRILLAATPTVDGDPARTEITSVKGDLPSPLKPPDGCAFHARCPYATDRCRVERPESREVDGRRVACHHAETIPA